MAAFVAETFDDRVQFIGSASAAFAIKDWIRDDERGPGLTGA